METQQKKKRSWIWAVVIIIVVLLGIGAATRNKKSDTPKTEADNLQQLQDNLKTLQTEQGALNNTLTTVPEADIQSGSLDSSFQKSF